MSKLKSIVTHLSESKYQELYQNLIKENAEKTAFLLKSLREKSLNEEQIIIVLKVNSNSYYTLRSRLSQRIEALLTSNCNNPSSITRFFFTNTKSILPVALKHIEKKALKSNNPITALTTYKYLKKINIGKKEFEYYDNLYHKQLDLLQTIDDSECLLSEYFTTYGLYYLSNDDTHKENLNKINHHLNRLSKAHKNHKLYVFQSFSDVIHRLFVSNRTENTTHKTENIDDIISNIKFIINANKDDETYKQIGIAVKLLEFEYFNYFNLHEKSENLFEDINKNIAKLLTHHTDFTYPELFLMSKIKRHARLNTLPLLEKENSTLFKDYKNDYGQLSTSYMYVVYRALSSYYSGKHEKATYWINDYLNHVSLKDNVYAQIEIKTLLAFQYCILDDFDLFQQLIISIQRHIRILKKKNLNHIIIFIKILKTSISIMKKNKKSKIETLYKELQLTKMVCFSPIMLIKYDKQFIERLVKFQ